MKLTHVRRMRWSLIALVILFSIAIYWELNEIRSVALFGVTPGQSVDLGKYQVPEGYRRLFKNGPIRVVSFQPEGDTYLPDWEQYLLYVIEDTKTVSFITTNKRFELKDECIKDLEIVKTAVESNYNTRAKPQDPSTVSADIGRLVFGFDFPGTWLSVSCVEFHEGSYTENGVTKKRPPYFSLSLRSG